MDKIILKSDFEQACNAYLYEFCKRYEFDYEDAEISWVGGECGTITCCGDYYVGMSDIRLCIDYDISWNDFSQWYDYCLRCSTIDIEIVTPNLQSWIKGCPRKSEDELSALENSKAKIQKLKEEFEEQLKFNEF